MINKTAFWDCLSGISQKKRDDLCALSYAAYKGLRRPTPSHSLKYAHLLSSITCWFPSSLMKFRTCVCGAAVLLCYMIWQGPVLHALDVEPPDTRGLSTM